MILLPMYVRFLHFFPFDDHQADRAGNAPILARFEVTGEGEECHCDGHIAPFAREDIG
jgi:hypothetical protein